MNTFAIKLVGVTMSFCAALPAFAQSGNAGGGSGNGGGSGSGAGGTNIDNVSFSIVGNLVTVSSSTVQAVISLDASGSAISISVTTAGGGEPVTQSIPPALVSVVSSLIAALTQGGGAGAGPLVMQLKALLS